MIKTAFSTLSCPDWSFQEIVSKGKQFGFDGVEIRQIQRETDLLKVHEFMPANRQSMTRQLNDAGFEICGLASSVHFDQPESHARETQLDIGKQYIDLAVDIGASFVRIFGDVVTLYEDSTPKDQIIQNISEYVDRLGEYAVSTGEGILVLIETHGDFADSLVMQETMKQVQSPAVGVLWDTHHPWKFFGEELSITYDRLGPWIGHTHWKDSVASAQTAANNESKDAAAVAHQLMSGHQHADYVLFLQGEFPALECARLLHQAGYQGWHCLEWEKMWHPEIEDPDIALPDFPSKLRDLWQRAIEPNSA